MFQQLPSIVDLKIEDSERFQDIKGNNYLGIRVGV